MPVSMLIVSQAMDAIIQIQAACPTTAITVYPKSWPITDAAFCPNDMPQL